MNNLLKNLIFILLIFLVISGVFTLFSQSATPPKQIPLTQLVQDINQGKVKKITVSGNNVSIVYQDGSTAQTLKETETSISQSLINYGVDKQKLDSVEVDISQSVQPIQLANAYLNYHSSALFFLAFFSG